MHPTVLTIDIGNTSTSIGLYRQGRISRRQRIGTTVRDAPRLWELLHGYRDVPGMEAASVCSVVPETDAMWKAVIRTELKLPVLFTHHQLDLGLPIDYPAPETIGADRLADVCGAHHRYGAPVVVADFGTALTFDVVTRARGYVGGLITPGLPLMFQYLAEKTALLPLVEPRPVRRPIGRSTEEAMQLGARIGYRGMVKEILDHLDETLGPEPFTFCATGGHAAWVLRKLNRPVHTHPDLTLFGLGVLYELNR